MTTSKTDYVTTLTAELNSRLAKDGQITRSSAPMRAAQDIRAKSLDFEVTTVARLHFEESVIEHRRKTETPKDKAHADLLIKLSPRAQQDWLGLHLRQTKADQGVFDPVEKDFRETCATCSGKGQNQCTNCGGVGERTCTACSYGRISCGACSGCSKRRCDICYGNGSTRQRVHLRNNFKADGGWDEVWEGQNIPFGRDLRNWQTR